MISTISTLSSMACESPASLYCHFATGAFASADSGSSFGADLAESRLHRRVAALMNASVNTRSNQHVASNPLRDFLRREAIAARLADLRKLSPWRFVASVLFNYALIGTAIGVVITAAA